MFSWSVVLIVRFLAQLKTIYNIKKEAICTNDNGVLIFNSPRKIAAFSFLKSIIINKSLYPEAIISNILKHEKTHIEQNHYVDILFAEILIIFFWFNPANWLLTYFIKENIEFQTDDILVYSGLPKKQYQHHLLSVTQGHYAIKLSMNFNLNNLKNRIKMMNKTKTRRNAAWRYFFAATLVIPAFLFQNQSLAQEKNGDKITKTTYNGAVSIKLLDTLAENSSTVQASLRRHRKMKAICEEFKIPFPFFDDIKPNGPDTLYVLNPVNNQNKMIIASSMPKINRDSVAFSIDGKLVSAKEMQSFNPKNVKFFALIEDKSELKNRKVKNKTMLFAITTK